MDECARFCFEMCSECRMAGSDEQQTACRRPFLPWCSFHSALVFSPQASVQNNVLALSLGAVRVQELGTTCGIASAKLEGQLPLRLTERKCSVSAL